MSQGEAIHETPQGAAWPVVAGIMATVSVFAISQGLTYPLLSILLEKQGHPAALIGLSAGMTPLGFIVSSPMIPWLSRRIGAGRLAVASSVLATLMLVLIALTMNVWVWFPLRFLLGFFANVLYVISETWMITIVPPARRGRLMGIYTSVVSTGFALGPLTLALVGSEGWPPFLVGIAAFLLCGAILLAVMARLPAMESDTVTASVFGFVAIAPLLIFAVFTAAAFEQSLLAMFPVYGASYALSERDVAVLITVFVSGNIALQIPLGMLAERIGARAVMLMCAIVAVAGAALLPVLLDGPLIWPMMFVWGAVAFAIYTMGLIELSERFSGAMIITGNAAFALAWGSGGIVGPPVVGTSMNLIGIQGLPVALGLVCGVLVVLLATKLRRRAAP